MRKKINPAIIFTLFTIFIAILILNRPTYEDHPVKSKPNAVQVENQALHNLDKPIIDVSGWQRPEEINYDTLSQNISGVIVRVHNGAQHTEKMMPLMPMVLIKPIKVILQNFKSVMSQLESMPI